MHVCVCVRVCLCVRARVCVCVCVYVTANMDRSAVSVLPEALHTGVYYGFGCVDNGSVHEMVMSIGTNPFYNNKERSMVSCP